MANDFLSVRTADDPLIRRAFETAMTNIRARTSNNVWKVTGPGILTQLHRSDDPADRALFDGFDLITVKELKRWVGFEWTLDYKQEAEHWTTAMGEGSIFRSAD